MITDRIPYSPIHDRPRLTWPGGARVAVWVVPNVEHYEYLPARVAHRNPWPRMPHPDVLGYGLRDYGNRVGLWRMADLMEAHGIPATLSLNMAVWDHYPEILDAGMRRGWDVMAHGLYNTRYHLGMSEDEERAEIALAMEIYRRHTGQTLKGWFAPAATFTWASSDLVAEAGITYSGDWYHDDQPCDITVRKGRLISVPYQMDINDAMVWRHHFEADDFATMAIDHFDTLWREGADQGRVVCIALHPFLMGQPHRIRALDRVFAHMRAHDDVWFATGAQIADWYLAQRPQPPGVSP